MAELRTKKSQEIYANYRKNGGLSGDCKLCLAEPVREFAHWKIIRNAFPYDKIANQHDMVITKRCVQEGKITTEEWAEFKDIKEELMQSNYDFIMEPTYAKKTIPGHFHLHLVVIRDEVVN